MDNSYKIPNLYKL